MTLLTIGDESTHRVGDPRCPVCWEEYPEPCRCGGLIHATGGEEDADGNAVLETCCDECGRSEEQTEEP